MAHENVDVEAMAIDMMRGIETNNLDATGRWNADDMLVWHNFDDAEMGWPQARAFLQMLINSVQSLHYEDIRVMRLADGWVQQHVLRLVLKNGGENRMPAALFVKLNDQGKVQRIEEYLDASHLAGALPAQAEAA